MCVCVCVCVGVWVSAETAGAVACMFVCSCFIYMNVSGEVKKRPSVGLSRYP